MAKFNATNWNYCYFNNSDLSARITFGAVPTPSGDILIEYYVTVLENDEVEVFQKSFENLSQACKFANNQYSHWTFKNPADVSGCGSCSAH